MELFAYVVIFVLGLAAGFNLSKGKDIRLRRENDILKVAFDTQVEETKRTLDWVADQMYHRDMMNVSIGNMREIAVRFEDGAISGDEAHLQYEMLRAEGQMHFDALDTELRDWYEDQITARGGEFIFHNESKED